MKVAIVHDYIKEYGGAERVLEVLHEIFPDAPVYTLLYAPKYLGPHRSRFENWDIRPSFLQNVPFAAKLISPIRLISPFIFRQMDLSKFDLIIVSQTGAYFPNLVKKGKAKLICYCHTPPRYLYGYPTARKPSKWIKPFVHLANHVLRMVDFSASRNVDLFIANSKEVKNRIAKFYRREAKVIYPPIDIKYAQKFLANNKSLARKSSYYLCGGRLARAKRIDLAIKACIRLGLNLKIFGKDFAGYEDELRNIVNFCMSKIPGSRNKSKSIVEFLGEVSDEEKFSLMANAKAYIFPSEFEDFGITPVEAMSVGCPVIAFKSGGVKETVVDGKTGLFFDKPDVDSLVNVLKRFDNFVYRKIKLSDCRKQSENFSKEKFIKLIISVVIK